jgi:hypothetical protein
MGRISVARRAGVALGAGVMAVVAGHQMGCSSTGETPGDPSQNGAPGPAASDSPGIVGVSLTLPGGQALNTIHWTITGPNGGATVVQQGSVDLHASLTLSFTVSGIPAGSNYNLAMSGTSTDGTVTCASNTAFTILAGMTTNVTALLQCSVGSEAGSVNVNGQTYDCATASGVSVLPAETLVGGSVVLDGAATGSNPRALTYAWSAPSGSFSAPSSATTNFTCAVPGPVLVTLQVSDGALPDGSSCDPTLSTRTATVICDSSSDAGATPDAGPDAAGGADGGAGDAGSAADASDAGGAADAGGVSDAGTTANLDIYRVGSGTGALVSTGNPVFVDEYTPAGVLARSTPMPTVVNGANRRLIASGTATSEGLMTRSADGKYVVLTGYDAPLGVTDAGTLPNSAAAVTPRVIGRLDASGTVDTTTALTDAADGNNPRGAASTNGTQLWITGGASGIRSTTLGSTSSVELSTTVTNLRQVNIFASQLYVSDSSGSASRLGTVGVGLPTTSGQTITSLPGLPTSTGSVYAFFMADLDPGTPGLDTLYVTDDGIGLIKYSLVGTTWVTNGTVGSSSDAYRGVTGIVSGTTVSLYAIRKGGSGATGGGEFVSLVDSSGHNAAFSATPAVLATAAANTAFRGIAFAPQP